MAHAVQGASKGAMIPSECDVQGVQRRALAEHGGNRAAELVVGEVPVNRHGDHQACDGVGRWMRGGGVSVRRNADAAQARAQRFR